MKLQINLGRNGIRFHKQNALLLISYFNYKSLDTFLNLYFMCWESIENAVLCVESLLKLFSFFEAGSHYATMAGLEPTM